MNPADIQKTLAPVVGAEIARSLARVAREHKDGAAFSVSVPSFVLVALAEKLVELVNGR